MKTMRRRNTTRQPRDAGFTLIEIMLALGVLGVGMVMVATLFPAAIMQAKKSDQNTQATIIADNARTILTMRLKHSDASDEDHGLPVYRYFGKDCPQVFVELPMGNEKVGGDWLLYDIDAWAQTVVREEFEDQHSNDWPPNRQDHGDFYKDNEAGWIALVRLVDYDMQNATSDYDEKLASNGYQFVVVPYKEFTGVEYDWHDGWSDYQNRDPRPKLVHFSDSSQTPLRSGDSAYHDVDIRQSGNLCELWFDTSDHSGHKDDIAKGSPVLLDGNKFANVGGVIVQVDAKVLGRHPTIVSLRDEGSFWVATLSGPLFDPLDLPDTVANMANTGVKRGIWVVPGVGYGAPSPALGCTVFRTQLQP